MGDWEINVSEGWVVEKIKEDEAETSWRPGRRGWCEELGSWRDGKMSFAQPTWLLDLPELTGWAAGRGWAPPAVSGC